MRTRRKSEPVDPTPPMPRGESDFEEKWIECDFELVFKKIAHAGLSSIKDTHAMAYRYGYIAGKSRRELEGSPKSD